MVLSEQEQALLAELERNFYASEADAVTSSVPRLSKRAIVIGALVALAGVALLFAGVALQLLLLGAFGFVLIVAGLVTATRQVEDAAAAGLAAGSAAGRHAQRKKNPRGESIMDKLNERWEKRQNGEL